MALTDWCLNAGPWSFRHYLVAAVAALHQQGRIGPAADLTGRQLIGQAVHVTRQATKSVVGVSAEKRGAAVRDLAYFISRRNETAPTLDASSPLSEKTMA